MQELQEERERQEREKRQREEQERKREEKEQWLKEIADLGIVPPSQYGKKFKPATENSLDHERLRRYREQVSREKAEELLRHKDIRAYLCPSLQTVSGDIFTVANTVAQVLAPLTIAGALSIPLVPILFASMGILIVRIGIANICVDYDKRELGQK
jgi:hypothetical protein